MMTIEQIADRIREEFRKHGKNDPAGWPLIAAGKIRAEMGDRPQMTPMAQMNAETPVKRYWFYSGMGKDHPLANRALQVTNGVCSRHPFDVEADRRKLVDPEFLLMYWQEITQEEYELYRKQNR